MLNAAQRNIPCSFDSGQSLVLASIGVTAAHAEGNAYAAAYARRSNRSAQEYRGDFDQNAQISGVSIIGPGDHR